MDYENNQDHNYNQNEQMPQGETSNQQKAEWEQREPNMYEYQQQTGGGYGMPPKKNNNKKIGIIVASVVLVIFLLLAGTVKVAQFFFNKSIQQDTQIDIGDNSNDGPISSVQLVSGSAISGITDVSSVVENVMPAVVAITQDYKQTYSMWGQTYDENSTGSGSGFIVQQDDDNLLIVTNNHVVEGADKITVTFIDETTAEATVKGTDSTADLAVITVKLSDLKKTTKSKIKVASLGDSDSVKVGQVAIAIGNALGYGQSVTVGYISAKDRKVTVSDTNNSSAKAMTLLQTDAAINPGNSGGALLDMNGNVIGINSVKYADSAVEGMGYAIPMSKAVPIINELMKRKVLSEEEKGYLGITGRNISSEVSEAYGLPVGIYIVEVAEDGSAKEAGIQQGDVITKVNDREVTTIQEVQEIVNSYEVGTKLNVTVKRSHNGAYKEQEMEVVLKDASTLDELESGEDISQGGDSSNGNENDNSEGSNDSSQTIPWGNFY